MSAEIWLQRALEALERGEEPDTILAQVPEPWRAEVRAALEAAQWLQHNAAPALHQAAATWNPPAPPPLPRPEAAQPWWARWNWRGLPHLLPRLGWAVTLMLVAALTTWGVARAASTALPGQWAYPLRQAWEEARWTLARTSEQRLFLALDWAEARLEQAQHAAKQGQTTRWEGMLDEYARYMQHGYRQWLILPEAQQQAQAPKVRARLHAQGQMLQRLLPADTAMLAAWQRAHHAWQVFWFTLVVEPASPMTTLVAPAATPPRHPPSTPMRPSPPATSKSTTPARASSTPAPTATPVPLATPTPTPEPCVQRGQGRGQNQCVPNDQGRGNDNGHPTNEGNAPPRPEPDSDGAPGDSPSGGPPDNRPGRGP